MLSSELIFSADPTSAVVQLFPKPCFLHKLEHKRFPLSARSTSVLCR